MNLVKSFFQRNFLDGAKLNHNVGVISVSENEVTGFRCAKSQALPIFAFKDKLKQKKLG